MSSGVYGRLESVIPPITVPAWMCMVTSQDPGSLGVYGFRNRTDHSYGSLEFVNSASIQQPAIWDEIGKRQKHSIVVGLPPSYPRGRIRGINVGCFLTPDTRRVDFTHPAGIGKRLLDIWGDYPVDVKGSVPTIKPGSSAKFLR